MRMRKIPFPDDESVVRNCIMEEMIHISEYNENRYNIKRDSVIGMSPEEYVGRVEDLGEISRVFRNSQGSFSTTNHREYYSSVLHMYFYFDIVGKVNSENIDDAIDACICDRIIIEESAKC